MSSAQTNATKPTGETSSGRDADHDAYLEDSSSKLTREQRLQMEENRKTALKRKRSEVPPRSQTCKDSFNKCPKFVDTGGGFLLDENELVAGKTKEVSFADCSTSLLSFDEQSCLDCCKKFNESFLLEKFELAVCDECRDPKGKHALITKTEAKKNYVLTDVDLDQRGKRLKFILGKNPHNARWSDMKLYLLLQVEQRALEIWGSEEKLLEELDKREEKRNISKQKAYQKKMKTLRMSVRSSLYQKSTSVSHVHEFGEESYNADDDTYCHRCVSCGFKEIYEKM